MNPNDKSTGNTAKGRVRPKPTPQQEQPSSGERGVVGASNNATSNDQPWSWDVYTPLIDTYRTLENSMSDHASKVVNEACMCAHCGCVRLGPFSSHHTAGSNRGGWTYVTTPATYTADTCPAVQEFPHNTRLVRTDAHNRLRMCSGCAAWHKHLLHCTATTTTTAGYCHTCRADVIDRTMYHTGASLKWCKAVMKMQSLNPTALLPLSLLHVYVQFNSQTHMHTYMTAYDIAAASQTPGDGLLGPIMAAPMTNSVAGQQALAALQQGLQATNPNVQKYHSRVSLQAQTPVSGNTTHHRPVPSVPPEVLPAAERAARKGPTAGEGRPIPPSTVINHYVHLLKVTPNPKIGHLQPKTCTTPVNTTLPHLHMYATCPDLPPVEEALFPWIFPNGRGAWQGQNQPGLLLLEYLKMRQHQWVSLYTMTQVCTLVMFQLKMKHLLHNTSASQALCAAATTNMTLTPAQQSKLMRKIPPSIPGSPKYWTSQLGRCTAICESLGVPHFMITLTMNEWLWSEVQDLNTMIAAVLDLPEDHATKTLFRHAPTECDRIFVARLHWFHTNVLDKGDPDMYGPLDMWLTRVEFQERGSPHAHIIIWMQCMADVERVNNEITACMPSAVPTGDDTLDKFYADIRSLLLKCKHKHHCTPGKCKPQNKPCTHGFPKAATPVAYIDPNTERWEYPRGPKDQWIVNYHPATLLLWQANAHMQRLTATAWQQYIFKYVHKAEPHGHMSITCSEADAFGLPAEVSVGTLQGFCASVKGRAVSSNEAAWLQLQEDLVYTPHNVGFKYVNIKVPSATSWRCNQVAITADIENFLSRPEHMREHNIRTFYQSYHIMPNNTGTETSPQYAGRTSTNNRIIYSNSHRHTFVSYTKYSPEDGEAYYFAQLLLHTNPTSLADMISPGNKTKTYMEECLLAGLFTTDEDLVDHHASTNQHSWHQGAVQTALDFVNIERPMHTLQMLLDNYPAHHTTNDPPQNGLSFAEQVAQFKTAQGHTTPEAAKNLHDLVEATCKRSYIRPCSDKHFADLESMILCSHLPNSDQLQVVDICFPRHRQTVKCMRISGGGGNGKSALLQYIVQRYARQGKLVIATATTAKAADRLQMPGAATVHRAFGLGREGYTPCTNAALATYIDLADVIVMDESSMASVSLLTAVNDRCHECDSTDSCELFAGKIVLITGDPHQLPTVCSRCRGEDPTDCPHQSYRWSQWSDLPEYDLHLNKRHTGDQQYAACMAHMRKRPLTDKHIHYLSTHTHVITDQVARTTTIARDARILCATNDLVDTFNLQQLTAHHGVNNLVTITAQHEFKRCYGLTTANQKYAMDRMNRRSDLADSLTIAVGCPVTITRNILPAKKLFNGTPGVVTEITDTAIYIQVPHLNTPVRIAKRQDTFFMPGGGLLVRNMYPIKCAYAQTVHSVQGDTITGPLVIHLAGFEGRHGLAYVACSRATSARNVTFVLPTNTKTLRASFFTPHVPRW